MNPLSRPAHELSEEEKRILTAAFIAPNVFPGSIGRNVRLVVGRTVLLSCNDKSDVLVVSFQPNVAGAVVTGRMGGTSPVLPGVRVSIDTLGKPKQQILLPGENLYFLVESIVGATSFIVSEVTP